MPYASAEGVNVYYEVHGDGPALLLCPGGGGNHVAWWRQIQHFRDRFRVIPVDFPGFGLSDSTAEEYDARGYPSSILAVLDAAGIDRAILLGVSVGCGPILSMAVNHPERVSAVILAQSTGGITDEGIGETAERDREEANANFRGRTVWSDEFQQDSPEEIFLYRQLSTFNAANYARLKHTYDWTTTAQQVRNAMAAGVQVNFLGATRDRVLSSRTYDRIREVLPAARVELVEGGSHMAFFQIPDQFNAAVDRLLAGACTPPEPAVR
jgi:3-oxoadipate enol-lactonase